MGINRYLTRIGQQSVCGAAVVLALASQAAWAEKPRARPEIIPAAAAQTETPAPTKAAPTKTVPAKTAAKSVAPAAEAEPAPTAVSSLRPKSRPEITAVQDVSFEQPVAKSVIAAQAQPAGKDSRKVATRKTEKAKVVPAVAASNASNAPIEAIRARGLAATSAKKERGQRIWCVDFARAATGVQIRGNAKTWWDRAKGAYERGRTPQVGAVMAFRSTKQMPMGHVAVVSEVVSPRKILVDHANWKRNQVSLRMAVVDVSPKNDWSSVRLESVKNTLGSVYPINGFIYPG